MHEENYEYSVSETVTDSTHTKYFVLSVAVALLVSLCLVVGGVWIYGWFL